MNNDTPPVSFGEILVGEMVGDVVDYLCHLIDAQVAVMAMLGEEGVGWLRIRRVRSTRITRSILGTLIVLIGLRTLVTLGDWGMVLSFFIAEVGVLGDYHSFTIDVSGWRLPLIPLRKALADPKLRKRSRRTGRWFLSSVM